MRLVNKASCTTLYTIQPIFSFIFEDWQGSNEFNYKCGEGDDSLQFQAYSDN